MALTLIKSCTKVGVAGGAFYWSVQQGVWGTPQEGADTMKRFINTIVPSDGTSPTPRKAEKAVVTKSNEGVIRSSWNQGTKTVFECLRDAPEYAGKASSSVTNFVQDTFKS